MDRKDAMVLATIVCIAGHGNKVRKVVGEHDPAYHANMVRVMVKWNFDHG